MPVTPAQTTAAKEIIHSILAATAPKGKRQLAGMFLELVDRQDWSDYYNVIPEPRCLNNIKIAVDKGRYKEASDIYTDLALVFWNALYYNEDHSQISTDAKTLKILLDSEWKKRSILPTVRTTPPSSAPQRVHGTYQEKEEEEESSPYSSGSRSGRVQTPGPSTRAVSTVTLSATASNAPTPGNNVNTTNLNANVNTNTNANAKAVTIRPKNQQLSQATTAGLQDMDVDILTPETPLGETRVERDAESDKIVEQLERGLPKWQGFGEEGWSDRYGNDRILDILHAVKNYKDAAGNRLSTALEVIPEEPFNPYLSYQHPLSLKTIETEAKAKAFRTAKEFEIAMARLWEKARRWHKITTESYGNVLTLQRLYQSLLSPTPPLGPPYHTTTYFAALRAGPGSVKPVHGSDSEGVTGVTTHRVLTKDRTFVDRLDYKGWSLRLADWVHLANPDDPGRPIIGQVFRCWVSDDVTKPNQAGLTVSWYYRPEQTFHAATREFWEGEIFKTSHFADHPIEDLIEKVACQFTARHIRGRPRPPFWYLGFPLYVCDSRYNDRDRVFVKIKNWNSCVPEEVRKSDEFMPIYPFEKMVYPVKYGSPFVVGANNPNNGNNKGGKPPGPGGLVAGDTLSTAGGAGNGNGEDTQESGGAISGRRTSRRLLENQSKPSASASISAPPIAQHAQPLVAAAAPPPPPPPTQSSYYPSQYQTAVTAAVGTTPGYGVGLAVQKIAGPDRTVVTAAGGMTALGTGAVVEKLPEETAQHFDRDPETNQVLWFAAPPVDVARPVKPKYSLTYLEFLAKKRKLESAGRVDDGDGDGEAAAKRSRPYVPPTITECLQKVLAADNTPVTATVTSN